MDLTRCPYVFYLGVLELSCENSPKVPKLATETCANTRRFSSLSLAAQLPYEGPEDHRSAFCSR
jgi:hypothetical protein